MDTKRAYSECCLSKQLYIVVKISNLKNKHFFLLHIKLSVEIECLLCVYKLKCLRNKILIMFATHSDVQRKCNIQA